MTAAGGTALPALVDRFSEAPSVRGIAVTGSYAHGSRTDGDSDIDLFVYSDEDLIDLRRAVAAKFADSDSHKFIDVDPFNSGDVWRSAVDQALADIVFVTTAWAEDQLDRVLVRHEASLGYSTAFWRTIATSRSLYDRDEWHPALLSRAATPYPDTLIEAIIDRNLPWITNHHPFSFRNQLAKAIRRATLSASTTGCVVGELF